MSTFCSCIYCKKQYSTKGIYSHYISSHTASGNEVRKQCGSLAAPKNKQRAEINNNIVRLNYANNKIMCKHCNCPLPYEKRSNKFCSSSCSASHNNNQRALRGYKLSDDARERLSKNAIVNFSRPLYTKVSYCTICSSWFIGTNKLCSITCRNKFFSLTAIKHKLGGNKNNRAHGWYDYKFAGTVWLESSYEYKVAKELDDNNINWTRPSFLYYNMNNKQQRYYPDFYLNEFDVYLDPKNDYLIVQDHDKIQNVITQNNVVVLILTKHQLNWTAIYNILQTH